MLSIERRREILDLLNKKGSVKVLDLATHYNVGKETIRRDLKALEQEWNISIVYGGAYLQSSSTETQIQEENITTKRKSNLDLKERIAKKAVEFIEPGDIIALNSGSTVECMLNYLHEKTPLSIITSNITIASKASMIDGIDVYIPSGKIRAKSGMIVGTDAERYIQNFTAQKCFFGVSAISLGSHITHPAVEEIENNRALMSISEKVFLIADHNKFEKKSLFLLAKLEEMSAIITDEPLLDSYETYCKNFGIDVHVAISEDEE
ncbi:DeoR/GlpR family DNA-binding transcription regulator [Chakrabartyella piscis]|uniref:DeoR/GlpR family DNA-binding transcription regulator n=1 Tax=Chakrabartyella piscis TaxID=2918914 RepID=UPI0029584D94|nr:DeoR/GlpR family DNA-binding transcription regulator [Chakrabartyella piscis]